MGGARLAELSKFRTTGIYLGALGIGYNTQVLKKKTFRSRSAGPTC